MHHRRSDMQRLINTGLLTLITATALCGAGCKRAARDDSSVSAAPKPIETTQPESQAVLEGARQVAEKHEGSYAEPATRSDFSWVRPGTWNSAPTSEPAASAEANETNEPSDEVTRSVET